MTWTSPALASPSADRRRSGAFLVPAGLAGITLATFAPVLGNGFVDWDDTTLLVENPAYRGLGWTQLRWMVSNVLLGHYVPLTWLTFAADYLVWGLNPAGYHLTNLLLHVGSVVFFYFVARRLLGETTTFSATGLTVGAAAAALFFAVHPLRVEAVAWATARRDVLSGALFLATVLLYLGAAGADGRRRRRLLSTSIGLYFLALAAKSAVVTLPLVLVLLDRWCLNRWPGGPGERPGRASRRVWVEKVPYLVAAVVFAGVAYYAHALGSPQEDVPWLSRAATVSYTAWFHVLKTALPTSLSPRYEIPPHISLLEPSFLASAVGVMGMSALALLSRVRWPPGLALWLYYGVVLVPVSGIVPLSLQLTADRYSYLACLGWAMLVGASAGAIVDGSARRTLRPSLVRLAAGVGVVWALWLGVLTWRQTQVWRDTESLWRHAVTVSPDCSTCHLNLGIWLDQRGVHEAALEEFERVLALRPDRVVVHANAAWALGRLGRFTEAVGHYRVLLARYPDMITVRVSLATALVRAERLPEAIDVLQQGLERGNPERTAAFFREVVRVRPDEPVLRLGLLQAYVALGKRDLAQEQYEALRASSPPLARLVARGLPVGR